MNGAKALMGALRERERSAGSASGMSSSSVSIREGMAMCSSVLALVRTKAMAYLMASPPSSVASRSLSERKCLGHGGKVLVAGLAQVQEGDSRHLLWLPCLWRNSISREVAGGEVRI